ncbi:uncharacterized protein LOC133815437 [Humulus lupulus]|uniref:uncharacterized protein LOC133815437 n=1 Tax=Humulus lupulus TaxID=3486 RepID=UPI002B40C187|nr:uncharacterized protein LOC133815437 [Humulus lupulus]
MAANDPNIHAEEILDEDEYPWRHGKQPMVSPDPDERSASSDSRGPLVPRANEEMYYNPERYVPIMELKNLQLHKQLAEAKKCNEEQARLAAEAQVAQAPPPQDAQAPPPQGIHVPPHRPRGRPCKNAATRRAKQPPPTAEQPVQPRPRRGNRAKGAANPIAEAPVGVENNQAPSKAQTRNPGATPNVPKPDFANSGPSWPRNGRQPPSPIRHPPSPIRHPSPIRRDTQPAHRDRERQAGRRHGNDGTTRERRGPHPTRSQLSRS